MGGGSLHSRPCTAAHATQPNGRRLAAPPPERRRPCQPAIPITSLGAHGAGRPRGSVFPGWGDHEDPERRGAAGQMVLPTRGGCQRPKGGPWGVPKRQRRKGGEGSWSVCLWFSYLAKFWG
eukprot:364916-Chlamydomonas_euryale.AAC.9